MRIYVVHCDVLSMLWVCSKHRHRRNQRESRHCIAANTRKSKNTKKMLKMVVVVLLSAAAADVWLDAPNASSRCADIPFAGNVSVVYFGTVYSYCQP